ncbi:hypothetical protein GCK72_016864 [Caenorhabditis remanei]|uniref:MADF domain-containing protein n=1 Tax=Caenorhabditis remanei TaxID=31234 RepID=A0A6A5G619_CAERE|nr:hypothetical protein GCK72_016864 [Caenorhabditis remanei]KAF1750316.1 hypothetical protein GCK72_016864 [Caenorhabditis remanei]
MTSPTKEGSPSSDPLEDDFLIALIDSVQRNPCVYNRYDPLHKVTDYKHEIWKMISIEIGYDGQPVELERKWKHMRDKYVRLRKQDKQKAPIKDTNKWYNYYQKMSFLDPYVEHRNRKRQKDRDSSPDMIDEDALFMDEIKNMGKIFVKQGNKSPSSSTSSSGNTHGRNLDSPVEEMEVEIPKRLAHPYDKMFDEAQFKISEEVVKTIPLLPPSNGNAAPKLTQHIEMPRSRKRKPIPIKIPSESPSPPEKKMKESILEEMLKEHNEDQVSFFIRTISQALSNMDHKQFATARLEISKVLYNIELDRVKMANLVPSCK